MLRNAVFALLTPNILKAEYSKTEGLEVGYYVVFSQKHTEDDVLEEEEVIEGKRIVTRIIRVNFERPSRGKKKRP